MTKALLARVARLEQRHKVNDEPPRIDRIVIVGMTREGEVEGHDDLDDPDSIVIDINRPRHEIAR